MKNAENPMEINRISNSSSLQLTMSARFWFAFFRIFKLSPIYTQTMKNSFLFVLSALLLSILLSNCKNKNNDAFTFECINSSFTDTIAIQLKPTYLEEDNKGNIIVLGSFDDVVKIIKFNAQGELLWQKSYPQLQGKEQGLVYIDENSFFIKTSTNHYEFELSANGYQNIWKKNGNMLDANNNYIPTYE